MAYEVLEDKNKSRQSWASMPMIIAAGSTHIELISADHSNVLKKALLQQISYVRNIMERGKYYSLMGAPNITAMK